MPTNTPEALFAARLLADPGRPLVTFYDDETGERAELSAKSLGNWVAKTHFLLLDELGLAPGDRAFVRLPVHWLAAPVLLGCWFAGLEVVTDPAGADVAFADAGSLAVLDPPTLASVPDVYSVSLLSMARSAEPPAGSSDYAASVRPQPDAWATVSAQTGPDGAALDGRSRALLAEDAVRAAQSAGLDRQGRLLWTSRRLDGSDWVSALLAPIAVGGSTVLVRHPQLERRQAVITAEHITATAPDGEHGDGITG
jgi:uncharacterized protein (TIGR03089 family)